MQTKCQVIFEPTQRQHINREDHVFYPMAREAFTKSEQQDLLNEFRNAEQKFGTDFLETSKSNVAQMSAMLSAQFSNDYKQRLESLRKAHD